MGKHAKYMEYLESLNEPQREAVVNTEGPMMIIAGAGSGKTRVLTYRIAHLIKSKDIDPFNILALTFTNKAAGEMRNRIEGVVGNEARNIWMGTFHSVFARILRSEAHYIGYPGNFTIYDTDDSKSLIRPFWNNLTIGDVVFLDSDFNIRVVKGRLGLQNIPGLIGCIVCHVVVTPQIAALPV